MGLSRNKVAVPEGAAGTTPFWRVVLDAARPEFKRGSRSSKNKSSTAKGFVNDLSEDEDCEFQIFNFQFSIFNLNDSVTQSY